jgi:hypothetical protein
MIKLRNMLIAMIAITALSTNAFAGNFGAGVTGGLAFVSASGTEKDKDGTADTSTRDATASNFAGVGSVFAEYTFDGMGGMSLGIDWIPMSADVNSKKITRTDATANATEATQDDGDRSAQAEIENVITYYAELPLGGTGFYAKAGYVTMDVNTTETALNSRVYGNTSVDGVSYGVGVKQDIGDNAYYKVEGLITEFDTLTLKDNVATKGNQISADLDVAKLSVALGFKF